MREEKPFVEPEPVIKPTFFQACVGLLLTPARTLKHLFSLKPPPYLTGILIGLFVAIFLPIIYLLVKYDYLQTRMPIVVIFTIFLVISACIYIFLQRLIFYIFKIDINIVQVTAIFCYGTAPLIPLLVGVNILDFAITGRLTVATFVLSGVPDVDTSMIANFLYAHLLAKILFLIILFHSIRILDEVSVPDALFMTVISSVPFYLAFFITNEITYHLNPDAALGLMGLLENSLSLLSSIFISR